MCLGIPGRVVEIGSDDFPSVTVDVAGMERVVLTSMLPEGPPLARGEWVLVHVGFALERLDEQEAARAVEFLTGLTTTDEVYPPV